MAKFITVQGTTSLITHVFAQSAGATNGVGFTGLSFSASGLVAAYIRAGQAAHTTIALTGSGINLVTYTSGAWLEVSSGTMPGVYEFHVPNAVVTASGGLGRAVLMIQGNASIAPIPIEVQLDPANGIFTPILAATTHAGATIPIVQTCATVTRALLVDTCSTLTRGLLVDTVSTVARAILVDTASVALTCATVTRALLVDTVSTVARALLVDTATVVINVNTATTVLNPVSISAGQLFVKKNSTLPGFAFLMTDTASHAPMTGLSVTGQYSLTGGAFNAMASVASEIASGWYKVDLAAGELNAPICSFRLTGAGADDRCITFVTQA